MAADEDALRPATDRWIRMVANGFARRQDYERIHPWHQDPGSVVAMTADEGQPPPTPVDDVVGTAEEPVVVQQNLDDDVVGQSGLPEWEDVVVVRLGSWALVVLGEEASPCVSTSHRQLKSWPEAVITPGTAGAGGEGGHDG